MPRAWCLTARGRGSTRSTSSSTAAGTGAPASVRDVMRPERMHCFEDPQIDEVLDNMCEIKIRRMPVLDRSKRLVGIVSLSDLVAKAKADGHAAKSGMTLSAITEP